LDNEGNPQGFLNGERSIDYNSIFNSPGRLKDTANIVYNGSASPKYFGSISNTITWKGFSLTANISYKINYYLRRSTISYTALYDQGTGHNDYKNRWQKQGDEAITNIPAQVYPADENRDNFFLLSEATVIKGDHVRLQFISFSYEINKGLSNRLPFSTIRLFINAANLPILWRANKDMIDPDSPSLPPNPRNYSIGITTRF
jgi:hypothetical protein